MEESASIVLTNKRGGFAWLAAQAESRYQGLFFRLGDTIFKTVAHLDLKQPLQSITNHLWSVQRDYDTVSQRLTMSGDALLVEFSAPASCDLLLDCRIIDDYREWGRTYEISREQGCVLIRFRKRDDKRDDNKAGHKEFDLHLAIAGDVLEFFPVQQWVEQRYSYDAHRRSKPWSRWVFNAGTVSAQRLVISAGLTKKAAIAEAKRVLRSRMRLLHEQMREVNDVVRHKKSLPKQVDLAYQCARHALDSLAVGNNGLSAGIPWFYQYWMRDEAVNCTALRALGRDELVKNILQRHLATLRRNPVPPAFAGHALPAIDAPGLVALRYAEHHDLFSKKEHAAAETALRGVFHALKHRMQNGLVTNGPQETWMDTAARDGARIEIQALTLALAHILGEKDVEHALKARVRETFWNGQYLHDGLNDPIIRPNVFIAAYIYPELLSREEWARCFDAVLPKLWLSWGGLATIDTGNPAFVDHYTGEDNASYHHGDSWFWLNNLAALVLHRTNAKKYEKYINRIIEASSHEILELGAIGHHAELSSARALSSHGCTSQAWSAAMFIELCNEVF